MISLVFNNIYGKLANAKRNFSET